MKKKLKIRSFFFHAEGNVDEVMVAFQQKLAEAFIESEKDKPRQKKKG